MKYLILLSYFVLSCHLLIAQDGPGGIGNTGGTSELKLWLKADTGTSTTTSGQTVSFWQDQSGANNHVSADSLAHQPRFHTAGANGLPYLDFDGLDDYLSMAGVSSDFNNTESTVFLVAEGAWGGAPFSISTGGIGQEMTVLDRKIYHHISSGHYTNRGHQCISAMPPGNTAILTAMFGTDPMDLELYSNALASLVPLFGSGTNPPGYSTVDRIVNVGRRNGTNENFEGKIYELIIYNRKLNNSELDSVHRYLQCKYDLENNGCGAMTPCGPVTYDPGPGGVGNTGGSSELKLWLRADMGTSTTANGQKVTLWEDQSGGNNDVSVTPLTNQPTFYGIGANNLPYIQFDGIDDYMSMPGVAQDFSNSESTVFLVAEGNWSGAPFSISTGGIGQEMTVLDREIYHHISSGHYTNRGHQCITIIPSGSASILNAMYGTSSADLELYSNGLPTIEPLGGSGTNPPGYSNVDRMVNVGRRNGTNEHFNGRIYELIIYNRKLTSTERDSVQRYLQCKYQIQNNGCGGMMPCAPATYGPGPGGVGNTSGTSELTLWLRADTGTNTASNGQGVSFWADQSGAFNHVSVGPTINQPTFYESGTNNMPFLEFDGNNDYLTMAGVSSDFSNTESSVFIVAEGNWDGSPFSISTGGVSQEMTVLNRRVYHHISSGHSTHKDHQCVDSVSSVNASMLTLIYGTAANDLDIYSNGLKGTLPLGTSGTNPPGYSNVDRMVTVGKRNGTNENFEGRIYELIVYDRKLTVNEQDSVERYLQCKYEINNSGCGGLAVGCGGVGIKQNSASIPATVYPNPSSGQFSIDLGEFYQQVDFSVLAIDGSTVYRQMYSNAKLICFKLNAPAGVYLLRLSSEHGENALMLIRQ